MDNFQLDKKSLPSEIPAEYKPRLVFFAQKVAKIRVSMFENGIDYLSLYKAFSALPEYYKNLLEMNMMGNRNETKGVQTIASELKTSPHRVSTDIERARRVVSDLYIYLTTPGSNSMYLIGLERLKQKANEETPDFPEIEVLNVFFDNFVSTVGRTLANKLKSHFNQRFTNRIHTSLEKFTDVEVQIFRNFLIENLREEELDYIVENYALPIILMYSRERSVLAGSKGLRPSISTVIVSAFDTLLARKPDILEIISVEPSEEEEQ